MSRLYLLIIGLCFSCHDFDEYFDGERLKNISNIAGIQLRQRNVYSSIDFADFVLSNKSGDNLILNLLESQNIFHTYKKIDKCCKFNGGGVEYDGIDNMERIKCNISKTEFTETYVNKREAVIMTGCQDEWKAKSWTIENLLDRFNYVKLNKSSISYSIWTSEYQQTHKTKRYSAYFRSNKVKKLIDAGYLVKIFQKLLKSKKGWTHRKAEYKKYMLELLEEYTFPKPMPEDVFPKYHIDVDEAYLILATAGTGELL